ncbi:MAG: hypothetical protein AAGL68_01040 [Pseudomonadota bacterium]
MSKAIALARTPRDDALTRQVEIARAMIVLGCGAALIFAGQPLPL